MQVYYIDANYFLRFVLKDNLTQWKIADSYFEKAKQRKIKLVFITEVVLEIEYVMRKVYKFDRKLIFKYISTLLSISSFEVADREVLKLALLTYLNKNIDFVDAILFYKAKIWDAKVLSFDKDFNKLNG
jgi:predicted nucleic-acid-binding protein